jgi:hypothetical protein
MREGEEIAEYTIQSASREQRKCAGVSCIPKLFALIRVHDTQSVGNEVAQVGHIQWSRPSTARVHHRFLYPQDSIAIIDY